jgi:predicted ribosomally synthesized peptide with SipW-like signal peptide
MKLRKIAATLMAAGLMLGLLGSGVGASFTDTATAVANINVGTLNVDISSTATGVVTVDGTSVTYTCPTIQSSAAGSCAFPFTVTSTGSIPANITVAVTSAPAAPFTDLLGSVTPFVLNQGQAHVFAGGVSWPALGNANLGQSTSITYTISAAA